jgi:RHH-type proline utilization regulon transcriptional repressor/proline dehydrogenase/delta 1-pyrroline-5-carboxylate dehydrogenase
MQDSHFKTQLFRFIDVLPSITDDEQVVTLAQEYLGDGAPPLFGGQWGLKAISSTSLGARLSGKAIRSQVEHMARTFIAGATVEEAAPRLTDLWQQGRAWSVDLLGEATISDREADRYRDRCMEALTLLSREAAFHYWTGTISDRPHGSSSRSKSLPSLLILILSTRKEAIVQWQCGFDPSSIWRSASPLH